ncbi:MAG: hypothetical protein ACI9TY_001423 [Alphaproteobacteria bacterium]|jgi:hypothetical protein
MDLFRTLMNAQGGNKGFHKVFSKAKKLAKAARSFNKNKQSFAAKIQKVTKLKSSIHEHKQTLSDTKQGYIALDEKKEILTKANEQKKFFEAQGVKVRLKDEVLALHQDIAESSFQQKNAPNFEDINQNIADNSIELKEKLAEIRPEAAFKMVEKLSHLVTSKNINKDEVMTQLNDIKSRILDHVSVEDFQTLNNIKDNVISAYPGLADNLKSGDIFALNEDTMEALADKKFDTVQKRATTLDDNNEVVVAGVEPQAEKSFTTNELLHGTVTKAYTEVQHEGKEGGDVLSVHMSDDLLKVSIQQHDDVDIYMSESPESQKVESQEFMTVAKELSERIHPQQFDMDQNLMAEILTQTNSEEKQMPSLGNMDIDIDDNNPKINNIDDIEFDQSLTLSIK